jgi:hypothetical protein
MRVLFVADYFADFARDPNNFWIGGAEQTDAAVIAACPWPIERAPVRELAHRRLEDFDLLVLGNLETSTASDCEKLARHGRHVLFEHDYRMCRYRGDPRHGFFHRLTGRCVCRQQRFGKLFQSALGAVFLTRLQLERYRLNPFLRLPQCEVLGGSVMGDAFFESVRNFRARQLPKQGTIVVHSKAAIKGYDAALAYCKEHGLEPTVVQNASPAEMLEQLARAERLVFMPAWYEPASRLAVEARFLGCHVVSNHRLGVAGEPWWNQPDEVGFELLRAVPQRFWETVERFARRPV